MILNKSPKPDSVSRSLSSGNARSHLMLVGLSSGLVLMVIKGALGVDDSSMDTRSDPVVSSGRPSVVKAGGSALGFQEVAWACEVDRRSTHHTMQPRTNNVRMPTSGTNSFRLRFSSNSCLSSVNFRLSSRDFRNAFSSLTDTSCLRG